MFKKCQVVILPSNKKASNILLKDNKELYFQYKEPLTNYKCQHLYITSDDEIKENDWCYDKILNIVFQTDKHTDFKYINQTDNVLKIIATTDSSLTMLKKFGEYSNDNHERDFPEYPIPLPKPSQSFIEVFVREYNKGNIITDVLVEYKGKYRTNPDGEPIGLPVHNYQPKVNPKDNTITIKKVKDTLKDIMDKSPEIREEVIAFAKKYANRCQAPIQAGDKWIEENL